MSIENAPASEPGSDHPSPSDVPSPPRVSRPGGVVRWVRAHKLRSLIIVFLLVLIAELATIPLFSVAKLRTENPSRTALMRQREHEAASDGKQLTILHQWIPLSEIPEDLINAVIVAEDGTFFAHSGIDWFEVQESFEVNLDRRRVIRGASTITQQLAKNLYLSTSKDPVRKLKEVTITLLLEHYLSKQRILEIYLNVIEWGKGIFGVEAAARTYFGKPASAMTLDEATRLAAVIPNPLRHRPDEDSRYVRRRKQIVLERMAARHFTDTTTSGETASKTLVEVPSGDPAAGTMEQGIPPADSTAIDEDDDNGL